MTTGLKHFQSKTFHFITYLLLASQFSCKNNDDGLVACTEEFRTVGIEVIKDSETNPLTYYYTIDLEKGDTIKDIYEAFENYYPVLTDNYQSELKNDQREFLFEGFIESEKVVSEIFIIAADECHITKISGETKVVLD